MAGAVGASLGSLLQQLAFQKREVKVGPLSVSPMGFGTWAWGNQLLWNYEPSMDAELQEVFNLALESGVNIFDTADSYGTGRLNGRSELLLGKFIREFPGAEQKRKRIAIATKFAAYPWRLTPGQIVKACKSSLERLEMDQLGIGQLHWSASNYAPYQERALWDGLAAVYQEHDWENHPESAKKRFSTWKFSPQPLRGILHEHTSSGWRVMELNSQNLQGLVKAVGVSNYGPKQLVRVQRYLERKGVPLSTAQVQFSLISYGPDQKAVKDICDDLGIGLIAYSPLGLGMLTAKYSASNLPSGPRGFLFRRILPGLEPLLELMESIAVKRNKTVSQVAINWCIRKGTIPIPGVKTLEQAKDNLGALGWRLTAQEIYSLESAAAEAPRGMIQNIFQTS